jgi:hypothetical protein
MPSTHLGKAPEAVLEAVIEDTREMVVLLPAGGTSVSYLASFAQQLAPALSPSINLPWIEK